MKKTRKPLIALVLSLCLLLTCAPSAALALSGSCGTNVTWEWNDRTGALTISGSGAMDNFTYNTVTPWYAFRASIRSVTVGSGVTRVSKYAFENCENLTTVRIGSGVSEIGIYAFKGCVSLRTVTLPSSLTKIGSYAFRYCACLSNVMIPDSVTSIGTQAFGGVGNIIYSGSASGSPWGAENLNRYSEGDLVFENIEKQTLLWCSRGADGVVTIPDSVTRIGASAFDGCAGITGVAYDGTLGQWCAIVFENAASNPLCCAHTLSIGGTDVTALAIPSGVTEIGNYTFAGGSGFASLAIPGSVTRIGVGAFRGCTALTELAIPDSVTELNSEAFADCTALAHVTLGSGVTSLGNAFDGCSSLAAFTVGSSHPVFSTDENGVLYNKEKTELIRYPIGSANASFTVPDSVTSIAPQAFYGCVCLTQAALPAGMTVVDPAAFEGCASLTGVTIPNGVTAIGDAAFRSCAALADVTIPDSVTEIGENAFFGCTGLANLVIPDGVTEIGMNAFYGVGNIVCDETSENAPWGAIHMNQFANGIFVFDGDTKQTLLWCSRSVQGNVTIPDGVTEIAAQAFANCTGMTGVTIPEGVMSIGETVFSDCTNLQTVGLPDSLEYIEAHAFADTVLTRLDIPASLIFLGSSSLPQTVTLITVSDAVRELDGLDPFGIVTPRYALITGDGLTSIPACLSGAYSICLGSGFDHCESLGDARPHDVHLPDTITDLGEDALYGVNYICAEADNTFAENYARTHQMGFRVCEGHADGGDFGHDDFYGENVFRRYDPKTDTSTFYGSGPMFDRAGGWDDSGTTYTRIVFEAGVTYVGAFVFEGAAIGELVLPDAPISLNADAFNMAVIDCVVFPSGATDPEQYAIDYATFDNCTVYGLELGGLNGFPNGFRFTEGDNYVLQSLTVGENTTVIPDNACNCFGALRSLTLPQGLQEIGTGAFESCEQLQSVAIPDGVTTIGDYAFDYCTGLQSVSLPDGLSSLGDWAFCNCTSLTRITIPDGLTSIGESVFEDCAALTEITIPDSVTEIGANAFSGTALDHVHLPAGLESIDATAFGDSLTYVCCDTQDCPVVRQYAETVGIEFRLCEGHIVLPRLAGDADGDRKVTLKDAVQMRRYLVGGWDVTIDTDAADVDADGDVTLLDIVLVYRFLAGGWNVVLL